MGKNRRVRITPPEDRDADFPEGATPDPDALVAKLLTLARATDDGRVAHEWAVALVYMLSDDETAQRLAASRVDGEVSWEPGPDDVPAHIEGPYCPSCRKLRGPLPAQTLCGESKPGWLKRREIDADLRRLPRDQRRSVEVRARRLAREERRTLAREFGPSQRSYAVRAHINEGQADPSKPEAVHFGDPESISPDIILYEAA